MRWDARRDVATWVEAGLIESGRARDALRVTGAVASRDDWRRFLERAVTWLGVIALAAALGFFVAANWQALGRFGKLALVESVIVVALGLVAWRGLDDLWGRAAIFVASLAVGTLLALVGQTYQTGADTYELFAVWALALVPWALVARQPALWLLWVLVLDLAVWLYAGTSVRWWGLVFHSRDALWMILAIHAIALVVWELASGRDTSRLDTRWVGRLLAVGAGIAGTALVVEAIAGSARNDARAWVAGAAYLALLAGLHVAYRVRRVDLFLLAAGVLSAIVVIVTLLVKAGIIGGGFGGFLLIGVVIIGLAAAAAHWLRRIAREAGG